MDKEEKENRKAWQRYWDKKSKIIELRVKRYDENGKEKREYD